MLVFHAIIGFVFVRALIVMVSSLCRIEEDISTMKNKLLELKKSRRK